MVRRLKPRPTTPKPVLQHRPAPAAEALKDSDVRLADKIRVLSGTGTGLFQNGQTVGEFLSAVPDRHAGLSLLYRAHRARLIGFQAGAPAAG